jgi:hypothetical protein
LRGLHEALAAAGALKLHCGTVIRRTLKTIGWIVSGIAGLGLARGLHRFYY